MVNGHSGLQSVEFFNLLSDTRHRVACSCPAGVVTVTVAVAWDSLVPGAGIVFVRISAAVLQCCSAGC